MGIHVIPLGCGVDPMTITHDDMDVLCYVDEEWWGHTSTPQGFPL
jgi:hypothetical protein